MKRNDSLEGSLDRVFFATELEFTKILVPRLPQNKSNVNMESAGWINKWINKFLALKITSNGGRRTPPKSCKNVITKYLKPQRMLINLCQNLGE